MDSEINQSVSTVTETFDAELPERLAETVRNEKERGNVCISISVKSKE